MAQLVAQWQRPTLVIAHNKTLAAQLYSEFKEFLPHNAVEYFVSYYDYYQPEAYIPRTDTYIERTPASTTNRPVAPVRHPIAAQPQGRADRRVRLMYLRPGQSGRLWQGGHRTEQRRAAQARQDSAPSRGHLLHPQRREFHARHVSRSRRYAGYLSGVRRVRVPRRVLGDEIDRIVEFEPLTGEILGERDKIEIYPAKHFITPQEKLQAALEHIESELEEHLAYLQRHDRLLEAQRLEQRTRYDIEMLQEVGYCSGIENYSRHLGGREAGSTPWTLLDYFPDDFLIIVDESHMTIPQLHGMYNGDRARKETLIDFGFRLPSALDNRPLRFSEFEDHIHQIIYASATPGPYELAQSSQIVEQIIRPTGLVDPQVEIRPTKGQIDDLVKEIRARVDRKERTLVTTLTKRMAEELADYLLEAGIKVHYLHSEIHTLERVEILRDLRSGMYDVVVGINLLREGLDLPEVSLVAIWTPTKKGSCGPAAR